MGLFSRHNHDDGDHGDHGDALPVPSHMPVEFREAMGALWAKAGRELLAESEEWQVATTDEEFYALIDRLNRSIAAINCSAQIWKAIGDAVASMLRGDDAIVPWDQFVPAAAKHAIDHMVEDHGIVVAPREVTVPDVVPDDWS